MTHSSDSFGSPDVPGPSGSPDVPGSSGSPDVPGPFGSPDPSGPSDEPGSSGFPEQELHPLAPAIVRVWRIKTGLFSLIPVAGALIYDILNAFGDDKLLPFGVLTLLTLLVLGSVVWWLPSFRHRYWGYRLTDEELYLVHGVFNRVRTIVPLKRIQHLDVSQDLFEREYDLGKLIIHTAGTRSSDIPLPGLRLEEAERLRDAMKRFIVDEAL